MVRGKKIRTAFYTVFIIHYSLTISAQDTTRVFSFADFSDLIMASHPIVRQAGLLSEEARQEVLQARGAFDPKLSSGFDEKTFGGKHYFNTWANELKVPVMPAGVDLKVFYDRFRGDFVNRSQITPNSGLAGVGITVPIGQGLLIDARRATLQQAQLMVNEAEAERVKQINKVWFSAAKDYWNWYMAFQRTRLLQEGFDLADTRFRALRQRALIGDAAVIDTVEAQITVQDRQVQLEQALVELRNTRLILSTYLWSQDGQPLELPERAVPQQAALSSLSGETVQRLVDRAGERHPDLIKLDVKIQQLSVEERFRREMLKPQLNLSANLLTQAPMFSPEVPDYRAFGVNNRKIGVDFVFPLFLRKERGKLRQVQIKSQQTGLERQQVRRDVINGVYAVHNDMLALERQIVVQDQAVRNQRRLLNAEQQKFEIGESSLFLVNSRETKLIDMEIKLEEIRSKYQKAVAELYYAAGTTTI